MSIFGSYYSAYLTPKGYREFSKVRVFPDSFLYHLHLLLCPLSDFLQVFFFIVSNIFYHEFFLFLLFILSIFSNEVLYIFYSSIEHSYSHLFKFFTVKYNIVATSGLVSANFLFLWLGVVFSLVLYLGNFMLYPARQYYII